MRRTSTEFPVPSTKRLVCLANSRKLSGRCIAGREWNGTEAGGWIRTVSARDGGAVSEYERQYEDGSDPRVLDIVDVPVLEARPMGYQTENWLLDPEFYWQKAGRLSPCQVSALVDPPAPLWLDGHHTFNGHNDKIPVALADSVTASLRLLLAEGVRIDVVTPGEAFGNKKRRVQGRFQHAGQEYALWVTDPDFERAYLAKPNGTYSISECYLTISLGEPYGGACYKLIAAIIPAP